MDKERDNAIREMDFSDTSIFPLGTDFPGVYELHQYALTLEASKAQISQKAQELRRAQEYENTRDQRLQRAHEDFPQKMAVGQGPRAGDVVMATVRRSPAYHLTRCH
jgi:hypothetical protein